MLDRYGEPIEPDDIWAARAMAVVACGLCDDDGYRGTVVCDHVDRREVAREGLRKCRRALTKSKLKAVKESGEAS